MDTDALGELHLRQLSLPAELPDLTSDQLYLDWRTCRHLRALLCYIDNRSRPNMRVQRTKVKAATAG